jgi:hypothetical protein
MHKVKVSKLFRISKHHKIIKLLKKCIIKYKQIHYMTINRIYLIKSKSKHKYKIIIIIRI